MLYNTIDLGFTNLYLFELFYIIITIITVVSTALEGFSKSVSKHAGVILGLAFGFMFASSLAIFLRQNLDIPIFWLTFISYLSIIILTFIIIKIFGIKLEKIFEVSGLKVLDTILGLLYGLLEALLFVLLIHILFIHQNIIEVRQAYFDSKLVSYILTPVAQTIVPYLGKIINV